MTKETEAQIEALLADGLSHSEIAATLGISRNAIRTRYPGTGWDPVTSGAFGRMIRDTNAAMRGTR